MNPTVSLAVIALMSTSVKKVYETGTKSKMVTFLNLILRLLNNNPTGLIKKILLKQENVFYKDK